MNKEHKIILDLIRIYLKKHPDQRFGQALFNLRVNEFKNIENPSESNFEIRDIHNDNDSEIIVRINNSLEWYKLQETVIKAKSKVSDLGGMTVYERLYATGLMDMFDKMLKTNKKYAEYILESLKVDRESIAKILNK